jgi:hypothetical protein
VLVVRIEGRLSPRFTRFLGALEADGVIRRFEGRLERYDYVPLVDAAAAAAEVRRRWAAQLSN